MPGLKEYLDDPNCLEKKRQFNNTVAKINNNVNYKLYYFPLHTRGEPIRMMLAHSGLEWEDKVTTFQQWPELKPNVPGNQLPTLELNNGTRLGQSLAIVRYIGMQHGYYPIDADEAQHVDELCDGFNDILGVVYKPHFTAPAERDTSKFFNETLPNYLNIIDSECARGNFIAGEKLTIADFMVGSLYVNYFTNPQVYEPENWEKVLAKFPNFKAYGERFAAANKVYLDQRPKYPV